MAYQVSLFKNDYRVSFTKKGGEKMKIAITLFQEITSKKGTDYTIVHYVDVRNGKCGSAFVGSDEFRQFRIGNPDALVADVSKLKTTDVEFDGTGRLVSIKQVA